MQLYWNSEHLLGLLSLN